MVTTTVNYTEGSGGSCLLVCGSKYSIWVPLMMHGGVDEEQAENILYTLKGDLAAAGASWYTRWMAYRHFKRAMKKWVGPA